MLLLTSPITVYTKLQFQKKRLKLDEFYTSREIVMIFFDQVRKSMGILYGHRNNCGGFFAALSRLLPMVPQPPSLREVNRNCGDDNTIKDQEAFLLIIRTC